MQEMDALDRRGDKAAGKLLRRVEHDLGLTEATTPDDDSLARVGRYDVEGQTVTLRLVGRGLASIGQRGLLGRTRYHSAKVRVFLELPGFSPEVGAAVLIGRIPGFGDELGYETSTGAHLVGHSKQFRRVIDNAIRHELSRPGRGLEQPHPAHQQPELSALDSAAEPAAPAASAELEL